MSHKILVILENALDWVYREWNRKPVTFVGYGNVGGSRAIEWTEALAARRASPAAP